MVRLITVPSFICESTIFAFALLISLILILFQTDADFKTKWVNRASNLMATWDAIGALLLPKMMLGTTDPNYEQIATDAMKNDIMQH